MYASDCLIKEVRVSTRMIYKKDWCGDQLDKYTGDALVSLDVLICNQGCEPVKSSLRAVITSCDEPQEKTVSVRDLTVSPGEELYKFSFTVSGVRLWSTWDYGNPSLYNLKLEYADAQYQSRIGMKEAAYDAKTGVWTLNREKIFLRGVELGGDEEDLSVLKEKGVNAVWVELDQLTEPVLSQCDELGILVCGACSVTEADLTPEGITEKAEKAAACAAAAAGHVSLGFYAVDAPLAVYQKADPENGWMAFVNVLYESLASVDPVRPVLFPDRGERRGAAILSSSQLQKLDPRNLKLPANAVHVGLPEEAKCGAESDFACWEAEYLRIRKYDPVSALFLADLKAVECGALRPVLAAFEPGFFPGENGLKVCIENGKSFTARIWAVNDCHCRIPDVKLAWTITEKESGIVRAGNSFRLNLNPDSAEIPDQPILVTTSEDQGKEFVLTACLSTDEELLSRNDLIVSVL